MIEIDKAFEISSLQLMMRLTESREQARLRQADFRKKADAARAIKIKAVFEHLGLHLDKESEKTEVNES